MSTIQEIDDQIEQYAQFNKDQKLRSRVIDALSYTQDVSNVNVYGDHITVYFESSHVYGSTLKALAKIRSHKLVAITSTVNGLSVQLSKKGD